MNTLTESQRLTKITDILSAYSNVFRVRVENGVAYNHNTGIDISDADSELLSSIAFNVKGTGSGAYGYDHSDRGETKKINLIQPKVCKTCNANNDRHKLNYFAVTCDKCGGTEFTYMDDSRAGIDTDAHFNYNVPVYRFWIIRVENNNLFRLEGYVIDGTDTIFNEILRVQYQTDKKMKNFLPYKLEWYFSNPRKFAEFEFDMRGNIKTLCWCPDNPMEMMIPFTAFDQRKKEKRMDVLRVLGKKIEYARSELLEHGLLNVNWKSPVGRARGDIKRRDV